MVPFSIPIVMRHLIFRVPQKGTIILITTRDSTADTLGVIKGDTLSLDYGSYASGGFRDSGVSGLGLRVWGLEPGLGAWASEFGV